MSVQQFDRVTADGISVFYRHGGSRSNPTLLLLQGNPSSSFYYRNLMSLLSSKYYVIAPDFPGFGFTDVPRERNYTYSFENLTTTLEKFLDVLGIDKFAMYIFDFGAPTGLRLALRRPDSVMAVITQNGNAYEEGLGDSWDDVRSFWATGSNELRAAIKSELLKFDGIRGQYIDGAPNKGANISPEDYHLDYALLQRPGVIDAMLDLFYDYRTNVQMYPEFQRYFRERQPPTLVAWGKNDAWFIPPGAEAFKKDIPDAEVHLLDTGHFALAGMEEDFAKLISNFLQRNIA